MHHHLQLVTTGGAEELAEGGKEAAGGGKEAADGEG